MGTCPGYAGSDWRKLHDLMKPEQAVEARPHPLDDGDGILGFSDKASTPVSIVDDATGKVLHEGLMYGSPEALAAISAKPPRRLDFAGALAAMKEGKRVAREGWEAGMYLVRLAPHYVLVTKRIATKCLFEAEDVDATDWMVVL